MSLSDKIREARLDNKMTQKELANSMATNGYKCTHATISNWELNISEPDMEAISVLCRILKKDANYFLEDYLNIVAEPHIIYETNMPDKYVMDLYHSLSNEGQQDTVSYMRALKLVNKPNRPKIQILGQTAAGQPIEYGDSYAQDVEDIEHIPKGADYALTVNGDSMEPVIKNGQVIYIKAKPDVEDGTIAVVEIDGAVTCKKVYKWKDHIELQSLNTKYEPIIITGGNFRILGEVILNKK